MENSKHEAIRRYAKYIFLDVVQFSTRSAEAQSEIVLNLNQLVLLAMPLTAEQAARDCIFIPTGDGMCIAFINPELPYDIHIQAALKIIDTIEDYNAGMDDVTRRFKVRIGINQNTDILITDINNRTNVAGAGINLASRIMDKADAGQILVSHSVYSELQPSERYMNKFRSFNTSDKHGLRFQVFQFINNEVEGLNTDIPAEFIEKIKSEPKLDKEAAHYIAIAAKHRDILLENKTRIHHIDIKAIVLFWILAYEARHKSKTQIDEDFSLWSKAKEPVLKVLEGFNEIDYYILLHFASLIQDVLERYKGCFDERFSHFPVAPNERGVEKLQKEWPSIWQEYSNNS
jgi:class 3 adenylate cyclase